MAGSRQGAKDFHGHTIAIRRASVAVRDPCGRRAKQRASHLARSLVISSMSARAARSRR